MDCFLPLVRVVAPGRQGAAALPQLSSSSVHQLRADPMDFHFLTLPFGLFLTSFLTLKKKKKKKSFILQHGVRTATLGMTVPARRLEINYITVALGRDPSTDLPVQLLSGNTGNSQKSPPKANRLFLALKNVFL